MYRLLAGGGGGSFPPLGVHKLSGARCGTLQGCVAVDGMPTCPSRSCSVLGQLHLSIGASLWLLLGFGQRESPSGDEKVAGESSHAVHSLLLSLPGHSAYRVASPDVTLSGFRYLLHHPLVLSGRVVVPTPHGCSLSPGPFWFPFPCK